MFRSKSLEPTDFSSKADNQKLMEFPVIIMREGVLLQLRLRPLTLLASAFRSGESKGLAAASPSYLSSGCISDPWGVKKNIPGSFVSPQIALVAVPTWRSAIWHRQVSQIQVSRYLLPTVWVGGVK